MRRFGLLTECRPDAPGCGSCKTAYQLMEVVLYLNGDLLFCWVCKCKDKDPVLVKTNVFEKLTVS